jgi:hypothetical protein
MVAETMRRRALEGERRRTSTNNEFRLAPMLDREEQQPAALVERTIVDRASDDTISRTL